MRSFRYLLCVSQVYKSVCVYLTIDQILITNCMMTIYSIITLAIKLHAMMLHFTLLINHYAIN